MASVRKPTVFSYHQKDQRWVLIINQGPMSKHITLKTRNPAQRAEAIAEAKLHVKAHGLRWSKALEGVST